MIFGEWDQEKFIEVQKRIAAEDARIDNAKNFLQKSNLSPEMIADCCSLPLEQVLALKEELDKQKKSHGRKRCRKSCFQIKKQKTPLIVTYFYKKSKKIFDKHRYGYYSEFIIKICS